VARLGLSGLRFVDGPRGVARGVATCFPVAMARVASFDYALEERIGEAIGRETRALGANVCLAPCLNYHQCLSLRGRAHLRLIGYRRPRPLMAGCPSP
jgi:beta-glucosidase-like glycosyl hydrolase